MIRKIKNRFFLVALCLAVCVSYISSAHAGNVSCGGNCNSSDDCTDASACYGGTCMTSGWGDAGSSCNFTPSCNPGTSGSQCSCGNMGGGAWCQCSCGDSSLTREEVDPSSRSPVS